jgi:hypothetical protein
VSATERSVTFVVRIVTSPAGAHGVVELVRTGRKTRVETLDRVGEVISAMLAADDGLARSTSPEA